MHLQETTERVVLLDAGGLPIGTDLKATVHTEDTPLHLSFSCHVVNSDGQVLVTRRALSKKTWPGVWTNSFCGHPQPDEASEDSVARRASHELGLDITGLELVLPDFRYRAVDASGVVENEICPVMVGRITTDIAPDPDEVAEHAWMDWATVRTIARDSPHLLSPWCVAQVTALGDELFPREAS